MPNYARGHVCMVVGIGRRVAGLGTQLC